jgi:hypothetical protein
MRMMSMLRPLLGVAGILVVTASLFVVIEAATALWARSLTLGATRRS